MLKKCLEISRLKVTEDPRDLHLRAIEFNLRRRKEKVRRNFIIMTAGLGLDSENNFKLSYAFEAILRWVKSQMRESDIIFVPPAPSYGALQPNGQQKREGEFAREWLQKEGIEDRQMKIGEKNVVHYMDGDSRRGNAKGTKKAMIEQILPPGADNILVVYYLQALRALTVFVQEGIKVDQLVAIQPLNIPPEDKKMVPQLPYYDQTSHYFYEMVAFGLFATHLDELVYEFSPGARSNDDLTKRGLR